MLAYRKWILTYKPDSMPSAMPPEWPSFKSSLPVPSPSTSWLAIFPVSRPAVSQHLRVLKDAGLVTDSRDGTRRLYQLNPKGVARLRAHFDQLWTKALTSFQSSVEQTPSGETNAKHRVSSRRP